MKWIELRSGIREYMDRIIREDLVLLNRKRAELDEIGFHVYMKGYTENFVKRNRLLFEILISDIIPFNQMNKTDVVSMSLQTSKQTLDIILDKMNADRSC